MNVKKFGTWLVYYKCDDRYHSFTVYFIVKQIICKSNEFDRCSWPSPIFTISHFGSPKTVKFTAKHAGGCSNKATDFKFEKS